MLWGERILSAINSARPSRKEMNLDPYLTPYTNVNSTSIMDLNGKGKTTLKKKKGKHRRISLCLEGRQIS